MGYDAKVDVKAIIIQTIIIIVCTVVYFKLKWFFESQESYKLAKLSTLIITVPFGLYILFGKYVRIRGFPIIKPFRICAGLFFIFLMPLIWLIKYLVALVSIN